MDNTKKGNTVDQEGLQLVLEEFTNEQKLQAKSLENLVKAVNSLTAKIKGFEEKIKEPKEVNVSTDIQPIQEIVRKGVTDVKLIIAAKPQSIVKKFQILLFPEQDAKLFYKIVFGRWFLWLAIMLFQAFLFKFGIHWSNNQKEIEQLRAENDTIRKAWKHLYSVNGKEIKRLMDLSYINSQRKKNQLEKE